METSEEIVAHSVDMVNLVPGWADIQYVVVD